MGRVYRFVSPFGFPPRRIGRCVGLSLSRTRIYSVAARIDHFQGAVLERVFKAYSILDNIVDGVAPAFRARFPTAFSALFPSGTSVRLIIGAAIRNKPLNNTPRPCPRCSARPLYIAIPYPRCKGGAE